VRARIYLRVSVCGVCTCAGMWTDMYVCVPASVPMFCVCVCVCV